MSAIQLSETGKAIASALGRHVYWTPDGNGGGEITEQSGAVARAIIYEALLASDIDPQHVGVFATVAAGGDGAATFRAFHGHIDGARTNLNITIGPDHAVVIEVAHA